MPEGSSLRIRRKRKEHRERSPTAKLTRALELSQGALIVLIIIAAPWLFGCTERWSIRFVNIACLLLGACALVCWLSGRRNSEASFEAPDRAAHRAFFAVNVVLLLFCLTACLNARATFSIDARSFTYYENVIPWLPTSYDRARSWQFLFNIFSLFALFWSICYWLRSGERSSSTGARLQPRFKFLLWVFTANGFLLALQGLFQRLSNSSKLLWFRPSYQDTVDACFGPFSYRGNAADYLNLVWPVTFGFWYVLARGGASRRSGIGDGPELLLLPMFIITAAASFATLSRGGAIVSGLLVFILAIVLLLTKIARFWKVAVAITLVVIFSMTVALTGKALLERFRAASTDNLSGRTEIYENARQIAADFPWFGTGPGTFLSVYHLYRASPRETWAAFLHDDWLETRITFGRIGFFLVLLQPALLAFWTFKTKRYWISNVLTLSIALSVLGCLAHAKVDFPFQTHGVFLTFVVVCALLLGSFIRKTEND